MSKPNIKRLKYPTWFNVTFSILTLGIPLVLFVYAGFSAGSTDTAKVFKITFGSILLLAIAWWFVYTFVIKKHIDKLVAQQAALEHDYSIEIGNADAIKAMWFYNQKILTALDVIRVILYGGLGIVIALGVQAGVVKVKTTLLLVATCYIVAYTMKAIYLMSQKEATNETGTGEEVSKDSTTKTDSKY